MKGFLKINERRQIGIRGSRIETNKGVFKVAVNSGESEHFIVARLAGKLKLHAILVIVGDRVLVETSAYDLTLGRITKRFKQGAI